MKAISVVWPGSLMVVLVSPQRVCQLPRR